MYIYVLINQHFGIRIKLIMQVYILEKGGLSTVKMDDGLRAYHFFSLVWKVWKLIQIVLTFMKEKLLGLCSTK